MPKLTIPRIVTAAIACLTAASCCAGIFSFHRNFTVGERMLVCTLRDEDATLEIYRWRVQHLMGERALPLGDVVWMDSTIAVVSKNQKKIRLHLAGMNGRSEEDLDNFDKAPAKPFPIKEMRDFYNHEDEPANAACTRSTLQFGVLYLFNKGLSWDGGRSFPINNLAITQNMAAKNWGLIKENELIKISIFPSVEKDSPIEWPLPVQIGGEFGRSTGSVHVVNGYTANVLWPLTIPIASIDINRKIYSEYDNTVWSPKPSLLATYQITRGQQFWKLISLEQIGPLNTPEGMELILPKTVPLKKSYQPPAPKP